MSSGRQLEYLFRADAIAEWSEFIRFMARELATAATVADVYALKEQWREWWRDFDRRHQLH
jgi:hypothetical protein